MTFSKAIKEQDLVGLKEVVAAATAIYTCEAPEEPTVETVVGEVLFTTILDDETKWQFIAIEYTQLLNEIKRIPDTSDKKVEACKLIATNPYLRAMTGSTTNPLDELLA